MPQRKKKEAESSSDTSINSDDESKKPAPKKAKTDDKGKGSSGSKDPDNFGAWDLGANKRVSVRSFKNKLFVDIREFYMDKNSGELKPGKKGIALQKSQWKKLGELIKEIDEVVEEND